MADEPVLGIENIAELHEIHERFVEVMSADDWRDIILNEPTLITQFRSFILANDAAPQDAQIQYEISPAQLDFILGVPTNHVAVEEIDPPRISLEQTKKIYEAEARYGSRSL